jgi:hypothetical protein
MSPVVHSWVLQSIRYSNWPFKYTPWDFRLWSFLQIDSTTESHYFRSIRFTFDFRRNSKFLSALARSILARKTREGWPLLTVETEVNGDSLNTNERDPSLIGALCLSCRGFCSAPAAQVGPVQNNFFSHRTLFQFLCPQSWAGSPAGSPVS